MSQETDILDSIFGNKRLFKDKYKIFWCDHCECANISCPDCGSGSCSGGGCNLCFNAFEEWHKRKLFVSDYLSPEEFKIYEKGLLIKYLILETLAKSAEIDFKKLQIEGKLSPNDEEILKDVL